MKDLVKKIYEGELEEKQLELCVECPKHGGYVPVNGNCITLNFNEERKGVQLHGKPEGITYDLTRKCEHAVNETLKSNMDLVGIICSYKSEK